ncbi:MAG: class I SAM-dependent methyltransferase [Rubrivivax sp.]|nr:class I SAM-dependent methyltransferase [Rubrivivax sp.]
MTPPDHDEARAIAERYARRNVGDRYHPLRPEIWQARQDRERAMISLLRRHARRPLAELDVLEVGCGHGDNLLELLRLGLDPARLVGNELLPERAAAARSRLPAATRMLEGDATQLPLSDAGFDIVYASTVFSSILDDAFQRRLAAAMWRWVRPGGAVLWYDFTLDNPRNTDVRAVPLSRLRALFPAGRIDARRVTLAPPIGRQVVRLHPAAWRLLNLLPVLRTHVLAWIAKPA